MLKHGVITADGTVVLGERVVRHICDGCGAFVDGWIAPKDWCMVDDAWELDYCGACSKDWPKVGARFIAVQREPVAATGRHLAIVR